MKFDSKVDSKLDCKLDSQSEQGESSKGTALDAVVDLLNLEAEIIREESDDTDEPQCKKRRLLNNKIQLALVEICRESMQ